MSNVFISYVRDNSDQVDKLADELRRHGVTVWLDREQIMPGMRWQDAIRRAIREGDYFIACFSAEYVTRRQTYMNTEIDLAIDMLREMPTDRVWFIPILLSECEVPDRSIGSGQTLRHLQWEEIYKGWQLGIRRILKAMEVSFHPRTDLDIALIRIPSGEFLMGSDLTLDKHASKDEQPQHTVYLPEFNIAKTPVTNAQFAVYYKRLRVPLGEENCPAKWVNWYVAIDFCKWLSTELGKAFRLPTEAEWEKAARGTDGRLWPWGNQSPRAEHYDIGRSARSPTPVDKYPKGASPYSVLDMAGNVGEWTSSLHRPYPYDPADGREDLEAPGARVVRGSGFSFYSGSVRCASRGKLNPQADEFYNLGFRVVVS